MKTVNHGNKNSDIHINKTVNLIYKTKMKRSSVRICESCMLVSNVERTVFFFLNKG